ncbi:peroxiredoxin, partial [Chamaesiphon sp. GL140_3_metabinner_50]|uniref:peroxiredoxin n=1 Tax=Chamaesiphon sp. GL140_3_metabinner_50 TaxID=2970812 RepID=UPI0025DB2C1C
MAVVNQQVPNVVFKTRVRDESVEGPNPFKWQDTTTQDIFAGKRVVVFSLPGAFTPTCSTTHLPGYDAAYEEIKSLGVDEVYCVSVNDAFVMFQWGKNMEVKNVKLLPDGNGEFSRKIGMLVDKANLGFGMRSWRYSMVVNDGKVEQVFVEAGYSDNCETDP